MANPRILTPVSPGSGAETAPTAKVSTESVLHQRIDQVVTLIQQQRAEQQEANAQQNANHELVIGEVRSLGQRVGSLEERTSRNSERVQGESKTNMQQEAAIAHVVTRVDAIETKANAIETKVDAIHSAVKGVVDNPKVRLVGKVIFVIAATYAAARGFIPKELLP